MLFEIFLEEFWVVAAAFRSRGCRGGDVSGGGVWRLGLRSPALPTGGCMQPPDLQPVFCSEAGMLAAGKSLIKGENRKHES